MAGLNDVSRMMVGEQVEEAPQPTSTGSPVMKFLQESQERSQRAMAALDARRNQLVDLSMSRKNQMFNPQMMALAAGLLAPTKTGSFGESLGYGLRGLGEEQAKQHAADIQEAKMMYELEAEAMKQREAMAAQGLLPAILGGKMGAQPAAAPPAGVAPAGAAPSAAPAAPAKPAVPQQNLLDSLTDDELLAMASVPATKNVAETVLRLRESARKDKIKVKFGDQEREVPTAEYKALETYLENNDWKSAKSWYQKHGLAWNFVEDKQPDGSVTIRPMSTAELEAAKAEAVGQKQEQFYIPELKREMPMTPAQYARYQREGIGYVNKLFNIEPAGKPTESTGAGTTTSGKMPPSTSEKEAEKAGRVTRAEQTEKTSAQFAQDLLNRAQMAPEVREAAEDMRALAATNPKIYGLLQQPGIMGAVKRSIQEGAGPLRLPAETMETYKLTEKDLQALQSAEFASSRLQTAFRKLARTPGEGSISDLETRMYSALAMLTKDTAKTIEIKSNMIMARADFDEKLHKDFVNYQKENGGTYQDFVANSPEYKKDVAEYRSLLRTLRDNNSQYFSRQSKAPKAGASSVEQTQPAGVDKTNKWLSD